MDGRASVGVGVESNTIDEGVSGVVAVMSVVVMLVVVVLPVEVRPVAVTVVGTVVRTVVGVSQDMRMMFNIRLVGALGMSKQMDVLHNMSMVVKDLVGCDGKGEASGHLGISLVLLWGLMTDSGEATVVIVSSVEAK